MKKWQRRLIVGSVVIVAGAGAILWQGEKCDAEASECVADSAALGVPDNAVTPQKTIESCRDSQGYFCRMFAPANFPNILLVLVGIAGIFAAVGTLDILERQTGATEKAADAASESASAARAGIAVTISKERARLRLVSPQIHLIDSATRRAGPPHAAEQITYRVDCHGTTDAFVIRGRAGSWLSDNDGRCLVGWGVMSSISFPTVIKAGSKGMAESEPIDPITEYMVENTPPGTCQRLMLNLAIQVEYKDVFQEKTHWKMNEKYSWRLSYFANGDGFFSWDATPEKHYEEQEEAN